MLSRLLNVRLRAAERALREGRLEEAFRIVAAADLQGQGRGASLMTELAERFMSRARSYFDAEQFSDALRDLERAEAGGGPRERIAELRDQIRTVADEVARQQRTHNQRLDQARLRMEQGSLDAGRLILATAPKNDVQAAEIKRQIEARDDEAAESFARVERLLKEGQLMPAAERLCKAKSLDPHDPRCAGLESQLLSRVLARVRESIEAGLISRATDELACLRELGRSSPDRREMEEMIRLVRQAGHALNRAEFDHARQELMRLQHLAPKLKWVSHSIEQLRSLDETLTDLRAGPLGTFEGRGAAGLADTVALRGDARPRLAERRVDAAEPARGSSNLPDRILLLVDGGGSYLLLRGSRVSLGRAACSEPPDVPLFADLAERHAEIARVEDDYFLFSPNDVELDGRRTRHQLLKDGDRVVLGPKAKFTFRLPNRKSASAIMELSDTSRMPSDVRRVVLFSQTAMIGYGRTAHVQCQMAQSPLVLFERAGSLWVRPEGRGPAATEAMPVVMGNSVEVSGVGLVAKPWK